jgi:uncharacterized protein (TIGR04552 family)
VEEVRLLLRGDSAVDWPRLNLETPRQAAELVAVQELDLDQERDRLYVTSIRDEAVGYLRRTFDQPIPRALCQASLPELLLHASGQGHRQVCACAILKVMHVVHHLKAHELRASLPLSDREIFGLVEEKVYRVIGTMLAERLPVLEFMGGRKHRDGQYTKLLAKRDNIATQIYDKIRFRLITRRRDDVFPVLSYLMRRLFPFNYVIPRQSTNTLFPLSSYLAQPGQLPNLLGRLPQDVADDDGLTRCENAHSDPTYRSIHFVVDLPVRVDAYLHEAGIEPQRPGAVIFALTEFQIVDRETDTTNEQGAASHAAYKERQRVAVQRRLTLGATDAQSDN